MIRTTANANEIKDIFRPVADPHQAFGRGQSNKGEPKIFSCLNTPASLQKSTGITQKLLHFLDQENGYFCLSNYEIFQGITTV